MTGGVETDAAADHVGASDQMVQKIDGQHVVGRILVPLGAPKGNRRDRAVGHGDAVDDDGRADPRLGRELAGQAADIGRRHGSDFLGPLRRVGLEMILEQGE